MTRRVVATAAFCAAILFADASAEVFDLVAVMASAMSDDNVTAFAKTLSDQMPGRTRLIDNVRAMLEQADVKTSIEKISDEGDDQRRTLVLDWSLAMQRKGNDLRIENRREAVTLTLVREGKKWKVTSLSPDTFFAPPNFQ